MALPEPWSLFAVCAPGLEPLCQQELAALGLPGVAVEGGVEFSGTAVDALRANLWLRTASRVVRRLGTFKATGFGELRTRAAKVPWKEVLPKDTPVALRATCKKSRLHHSGAVVERVLGAMEDALGAAPQHVKPAADDAEDAPASQLILVRMDHDRCTLSADTSGALLHRRGYRQATGLAPLRETLAAAALMAAGWTPGMPLVDPMCGSGTFLIEAALANQGWAPGRARQFAMERWPGAPARPVEKPVAAGPSAVCGGDIHHGALAAARANVERAGVGAWVAVSRCSALEAVPPPGPAGLVVCNPPYGHRVGDGAGLASLYAGLGARLKEKFPAWRVALVCPDEALVARVGLGLQPVLKTVNGGIPIAVWTGVVPG